MNSESLLKQFELVEQSIKRAKLPFETDMLHKKVLEVSMYELLKANAQILNMVKEIGYPRWEPVRTAYVDYPAPKIEDLHLCPFCGNPDCGSDHK
jgi:hypothetical protein